MWPIDLGGTTLAGLFGMGQWEIVIVLVIVLVIFGPKQLPKLGKMFGKTMKEVRSGMETLEENMDESKAPETDVAEDPKKSDVE